MISLFSLLSLVYIFAVLIVVARKTEQVVADAANLHVADFDGSMEDAHLDAHADGITVLLVQQTACLLDTRYAILGFQRDVVALLRVLDAVGIVLRIKLELRGIFVALVRVGVLDDHTVLLALQTVVGHVVVPSNIFLVDELTLLTLCPDGTLSFVDTDDVYFIMQLRALLTINHLIGFVEQTTSLLCIRCFVFLCLQGQNSP